MRQHCYQIRIQGHLSQQWNEWFDGLTITNTDDGEALLCGPLADQAALHGVLMKIRDLGVPLLAVNRIAEDESEAEEAQHEKGG
jgi:hypothetical protein